jgi:hypothetical protein
VVGRIWQLVLGYMQQGLSEWPVKGAAKYAAS